MSRRSVSQPAPLQLFLEQHLLGMADSPGGEDSVDIADSQMWEEQGEPDRRRLRVLEDGQLQVDAPLPARMSGNNGNPFR